MDYKSITTEELERMIRQMGQKMERHSVNLASVTCMDKMEQWQIQQRQTRLKSRKIRRKTCLCRIG